MRQDIYRLLASKGRGDDTELAHITKEESNILKMLGGSGTTNPWTGLPEYDTKKKLGMKIPNWLSPHNTKHDDGTYKNAGGSRHSLKTQEELNIETNQRETLASGEALLSGDTSEQTAGEMNLGQTVLKAEDYKGMTPQAIVDDIFAKQYNGIVPPTMGMSPEEFKQHLAGQLESMPQFGGADETKMGFLGEAKGIAGRTADLSERKTESTWDATKYGLQGQASKIAGAMGSGSGVGMRAGIAGQGAISQGFDAGLETRDIALDAVDISRDTADLGYREGVYGLEQTADDDWETGFTSFLSTLPEAA